MRRVEFSPRGAAVPTLTVTVAGIDRVADGVVSLALTGPAGEPLPPWQPGAHIDLVVGDGLERQYSLCGDPADRAVWRIGVLRENPGRGGSAWVHERLRVGDDVAVRGPRNNFALVDAPRYLFVAGGIGITPLLPMIDAVEQRGAGWRLLYGGRRESSMAFLDRVRRYGERVTVHPEDRFGLLPLEQLFAMPDPDLAVYCCGPEPLIAAVEAATSGWRPGTLHVERFHPRPTADLGPNDTFEVVLARSGDVVTVSPTESIVDALEAAGVDVPTSCREGTCGTCETGVIEGEPDHRDSYLTEEEQAEGATMLVCCSRSIGPRLVLDL